MPRIPDDELERLKREVDLAALVRSSSVELRPHGSKDLIGLCPLHEEKTPSFVVTPAKNLFHCMGCGKGGSVVDFVMHRDGVPLPRAVEILQEFEGPVRKPPASQEPPVSLDARDQELMAQVLGYYRERLLATPSALDYLEKRGIGREAVEAFGIGFADRTLGVRLPNGDTAKGHAVRARLQKLGLYRKSGHEHFNGCIVFPIRAMPESPCEASQGEAKHGPIPPVTEIYGRRIGKQKSGIYHLYLPGPHRGLFNAKAFESPEVILAESVIDALTFWNAGLKNVSCIWGTEGFTDDHLETLTARKTRRVFLAYDSDNAGDRAAERDASRLCSLGIDCFRVEFPRGMDPNEYALKVTPASKSLPLLIQSAKPILSQKTALRPEKNDTRANSSFEELAANAEGAASKAAKEEIVSANSASSAVEIKALGDDYELTLGERVYRVRGLAKNATLDTLKVNLRVMLCEASEGRHSASGGAFHVDNLDLYHAKQRNSFVLAASEETGLQPDLLKRDLGKVLLALEELQEARFAEASQAKEAPEVQLSEESRKAAMDLLRDPRLLERILSDFAACGVVGEETNKLAGYLAAVSRKLDRPLAIIIQSTSAAGKTSLMEAVLEMMPEEERIKYSAMTGQSLYYLGESDLKHKILAIVEEEGAEKASYALKLLQSEGELTIASTGKDEDGRLKTEEYHVEGPCAIFLTTTAIDIDEELLNRCLVLTVDESREQTEAIHALQRDADTLEGLERDVGRKRILDTHRNAQRLLRPLRVVNPFAPRLTFRSDRTRTRRDHMKYLALIRAIALLHQHQRSLKRSASGTEYIEATLEDIAAANRIAHEVLGRSLDELPPQTRRLLGLLDRMVRERCEKGGIEREHCLFTRREVRAFTGWSEFQVRTHMAKLQEMEYLLPHYGRQGQGYLYELAFDGDAESERPQFMGLIDVDKLGTKPTSSAPDPSSSAGNGASSLESESPSPGSAPVEGGSRSTRDGLSGDPSGTCQSEGENPENRDAPEENGGEES